MPRVLIVDDDGDVLRMMELLLGSSGYETVCARNGLDALATMREHRPCLVLLDVQMPVMDGFEFRRRQIADPELSRVPVLCLTAHYEPAQVTQQMGVPCHQKQADFTGILRTVEEMCGPGQLQRGPEAARGA